MSDKLLDSIKGGSFGFAEDFLTDEPAQGSSEVEDIEEDLSVWYESSNQTPKLDLLTFKLGSKLYGLELSTVQTIIQRPHTTPYPTQEQRFLGGFQHGNEIYPLVDLYTLIQETSEDEKQESFDDTELSTELKPKVALVEHDQRTIGLYVPAVHRAYRVELTDLEAAPQDGKQMMFDAVVPVDGTSVYVVSVAAVFRSLGAQ